MLLLKCNFCNILVKYFFNETMKNNKLIFVWALADACEQ